MAAGAEWVCVAEISMWFGGIPVEREAAEFGAVQKFARHHERVHHRDGDPRRTIVQRNGPYAQLAPGGLRIRRG